MNKTTDPILLRQVSLVIAVLLLPAAAYADKWLYLSANASINQTPVYGQQQGPSTDPTLSDEQSNSGPGDFESLTANVAHASLSFTATGSSYQAGVPYPGQSGGDASVGAQLTCNTTITISSASVDPGYPAHLRLTFAISGEATAGDTHPFSYAGGAASYNYGVIDTYAKYGGISYNGTLGSDGWTGTPISAIGTFTYDTIFYPGATMEVQQNANFSVGGSCIPGYFDTDRFAYGSESFDARLVRVLALDSNDQPIPFTMESDIGSGRGDVIPTGGSFAGFSLTNDAPGRFGSSFQILDGTASTDRDVVANFVAPLEIKAASDVVELSGSDGDLQVVQIDWDPPTRNFLGPLAYLEIAFLPLGGHGRWESAVLGNYNGPLPTFFDRAYNPATDFHLGYYGRDEANHKVWAVINHSGTGMSANVSGQAPSEALFAAAIPFEIVSVVSRKTHGAAGDFDINLPLTGTPGVECRNSSGNHTLVFTFKSNLADVGQVSVTAGSASISGTPTISGNTMTVNLTGVPNGQVTTISLHNTTDVANQVLDDTSVSMATLIGDTSGNGLVNASDITQTKIQSGHPVTASNFREDVSVNGVINASDVTLVKSRSGTALP